MLVRFEVDACYISKMVSGLEGTASLSLSNGPAGETTSPASPSLPNGVQIMRSKRTTLVDQNNLIELASRTSKSSNDWPKKYIQSYLSGTPTFLLGIHDSGKFSRIEKFEIDVGSNIQAQNFRAKLQPHLNKVAAVLSALRIKVLELTGDESNRSRLLALVHKDGKLVLYERRGGPKLPDALVSCFK